MVAKGYAPEAASGAALRVLNMILSCQLVSAL
jgi:hypothetical protein